MGLNDIEYTPGEGSGGGMSKGKTGDTVTERQGYGPGEPDQHASTRGSGRCCRLAGRGARVLTRPVDALQRMRDANDQYFDGIVQRRRGLECCNGNPPAVTSQAFSLTRHTRVPAQVLGGENADTGCVLGDPGIAGWLSP